MSNMQISSPCMSVGFNDFIFRDKRNRLIFSIVAGLIFIQFLVFKYLYPFGSYIHGDSFVYLEAAHLNYQINTYPIGYSRLLRLFSVFSKSDTVLVGFQYLSIQAAILFLLFTVFYFYSPGKRIRYILIGFMVLNPLLLHLANLISSDCLFVALSMVWFALLLWIIHRPTTKVVVWHAIVLFVAFIFRYNALIYPFIAIVAFSLAKLPLRKKIAGVSAGIILCSMFILFTSYKYKQLTGYWQFSPFGGWLMANNAMYAYRYVDSADRKPVPKKFKALDNMVREYFDSTRNTDKFPAEKAIASTVYMWTPGMTLMKYRDSLFTLRKDTAAKEFKKWASMGPFYKEYGLYIIRQYPLSFARHFVWPNSQKYYAPPVEFLVDYNSGYFHVTDLAAEWFGYKSLEVRTRMSSNKVWVLDFYPILSGIINVIMLFGILYYILLKGWKFNSAFNRTFLMAVTVWLLNAAFTIGASSAALRFQSFPVLLTTTFVLLLLDWMVQLMESMKAEATKVAPAGAALREFEGQIS